MAFLCQEPSMFSHTHQGSHLMTHTRRTRWQIGAVPLTPQAPTLTGLRTRGLRGPAFTQLAIPGLWPNSASRPQGLLGSLCLRPPDPHIEEAVLGPSAPSPSGPGNSPLTPASLSPELGGGAEPLAGTFHRTSVSSLGDAARTPRIGRTWGSSSKRERLEGGQQTSPGRTRGRGRERAEGLPCLG